MVVLYPSRWWGWSPSVRLLRFADDPLGNLVQFGIPAVILGMYLSGITMRMTRTMMLEVLRQDYIRTAWSKGLKERVVVVRHTLKNALLPVSRGVARRATRSRNHRTGDARSDPRDCVLSPLPGVRELRASGPARSGVPAGDGLGWVDGR